MPLLVQLLTLQRKNLLVTMRHPGWCCLQCGAAYVLCLLSILMFFFVEDPLTLEPAATWEVSGSAKLLSPVELMDRPLSPLPMQCVAFANVAKVFDNIISYDEGQGEPGWENVDPVGKWFHDLQASNLTRDGFALLDMYALYSVRKLMTISPSRDLPRKTFGVLGEGAVDQLVTRIMNIAGTQFRLVKPVYEMIGLCNPESSDCRMFWNCIIRRAQVAMNTLAPGSEPTEDCVAHCGAEESGAFDLSQPDSKFSSTWTSVKPKLESVSILAFARFQSRMVYENPPGCKTHTSDTAAQASSVAPSFAASMLVKRVEKPTHCSSRRLHQTSAETTSSSTGAQHQPAATTSLQMAAFFNASLQLLDQGRDRAASKDRRNSSKGKGVNDSHQKQRASAILHEVGQGGFGGMAKLALQPGGLLEQALPHSRSRPSSAAASAMSPRFLASNGSGATARRMSGVDCGSFTTACECASAPEACAWFQWHEGCKPGGKIDDDDDEDSCKDGYKEYEQECISTDELGQYRFSATSCFECPEQAGCAMDRIWSRTSQVIDVLSPKVRKFGSEEEMKDFIVSDDYGKVHMVDGIPTSDEICMALHLEDAGCLNGGGDCSYVLRMNASRSTGSHNGAGKTDLLEVLRTSGYQNEPDNWFNQAVTAWTQYFNGFIWMQYVVDDILLRPDEQEKVMPTQWYDVVPFPRAEYVTWTEEARMAFSGPADRAEAFGLLGFLAFATIVLSFAVVSRALREKEDQLRDGMRMMGLSDTAYYLSMYLWAATWFLIPCTVIVIIFQITPVKHCPTSACELKMADLFRHTDFFWIWLNLFLACMAQTSLGLVLVPLVGRARTGRILAPAMMYFLTYVLFSDPSTAQSKQILGLVPGVAFLQAQKTWVFLEDFGIGVKSSTLNVAINEYKFSYSLIMLTVDIFLYFTIYWYFDQTGMYGSGHRPFYFLCTREYWSECFGRSQGTSKIGLAETSESSGAFETPSAACMEMTRQGQTFEVRGLRKTFKSQGRTIAAVDGVDFSMYPGEIYVLLGHNGAGKTTSINCLTGLIRPTEGQAELFGQNLWKALQTTEGRKQVGICPQHNVLWMELTCLEHVTLFGAFRGLNRKVAQASGLDILSQCGLANDTRKKARTLSGGMKRKLCLSLSLVGEPKLAFLDEPSSGMDPTARRDTWDFLRRQKEGRIIILTTHYMDEADVLGDRIGIMSKGQLQCLGSPIFLKQYYGCGYNLNFELIEGIDKQDTIKFVKQEIGDAAEVRVMSEAGAELVLLVDFQAARVFPSLFAKLDSQETKTQLGLNAWSIAVCHLEEVFLRVAENQEGLRAAPAASKIGRTDENNPPTAESAEAGEVTAMLKPSAPRQIAVMLKKRARYTARDPMLCFCQIFCPMVTLAVMLAVVAGFIKDKTRLDLSLDLYNEPAFDEGAVRNVVPSVPVSSEFASLNGDLKGAGVVDEAPLIFFPRDVDNTTFSCGAEQEVARKGEKGYPDHVKFLKQCLPQLTTDSYSSYNLSAYAYKFACALLETDDDQRASRYVGAMPVAADTSGNANIVMFANMSAVHIAPIATNLATNMVRQRAGKAGKVKIATHPLPITALERSAYLGGDGLLVFLAIVIPAFIFPFPTAFSAAYVIREKETRVKAQHFMSGVGLVTYWAGSMLADYFIFIVAILLLLIPAAIFGTDGLLLPEIILSFFIFSLAQIPFGYLIGSLFSTAAGAQNFVLAFNMGVTFIFGTAGIILREFNLCWKPEIGEVPAGTCTMGLNDWLDVIFRLSPGYCLSECMHVIGSVNTLLKLFPKVTRDAQWYEDCEREVKTYDRVHWYCVDSPLEFGAAGGPLLWLGLEAIVFLIIILLIDFLQLDPRLRRSMHYYAPPVQKPEGWEDEDVLSEPNSMAGIKEAAVHCSDIRKVYGPVGFDRLFASCGRCCCTCCVCKRCKQEEIHAVKGVNFALKFGEVFGLLGTNGAGKSSVFNMIAGHFSATSGKIHVTGLDMDTGVGARNARRLTGYCPQENALLDMLTTREHLVFYSNLKGIPGDQIGTVSDAKMQQLGLAQHAKNVASNLSGGNKRKLMVACALIGDPNVILMDEPSAGMDPVARRFMWSVIQNVSNQRKRSSVLLSTHSMEECEALCNRSAIMVNGVFRCIGTNRAIRERYGGGFELMVKLRPPTDAEMQQALTAWNLPADARVDCTWATAVANAANSKFMAAAVMGPSSPFADAKALVTPKVLAEWWLFTLRFQVLHAFVPTIGSTAELLEWHGPMAKYKLTTATKGLGDLFTQMEANRDPLTITEYSLSATTLEQIFNSFARHQESADKTPLLVGQPVMERQTSPGTDYLTSFLQLACAQSTVNSSSASTEVPATTEASINVVEEEPAPAPPPAANGSSAL